MPDVLVLIANRPIRPIPPRISAIVSSYLRAIILGSFGFQGRSLPRAVASHDDGPFWPKAYILCELTFWSKGYYSAGILFGAASCTERKAVFFADWRKWREQSRVVKIAQTAGSNGDSLRGGVT
jgi:hypothetical protein